MWGSRESSGHTTHVESGKASKQAGTRKESDARAAIRALHLHAHAMFSYKASRIGVGDVVILLPTSTSVTIIDIDCYRRL